MAKRMCVCCRGLPPLDGKDCPVCRGKGYIYVKGIF